MGNKSFQNEAELVQEGEKTYTFPYGVVSVQYVVMEDDYIETQFTMETSNGSQKVVKRRISFVQ